MRNALLLALLFQVTVSNPTGPGSNPTGRLVVSGTAPSPAATGHGTGSVSLAGGSTDLAGIINITTAGAPAATGTASITYTLGPGAYGALTTCVFTLRNSTGAWNARASLIITTINSTSVTVTWDNNAVALSAGVVYSVTYICMGQ